MKEILLMMYLITSITSIAMLSSFSTTFLTMKKCNRVVFQGMRSGAVHHNGAQCCMRDFYFFSHCSPASKNSKKIYVVKNILRHVHVEYVCGHSRT